MSIRLDEPDPEPMGLENQTLTSMGALLDERVELTSTRV